MNEIKILEAVLNKAIYEGGVLNNMSEANAAIQAFGIVAQKVQAYDALQLEKKKEPEDEKEKPGPKRVGPKHKGNS